jgi:2-polyprenyl-6-methoxyphenol hydroxylase-like FAD-dependent oxidoreductase
MEAVAFCSRAGGRVRKKHKCYSRNLHETIAEQLMAQPAPASASSVVCNTYHYGGKAALVGDAAHATGGASGQGVKSALMNSVALSECVAENRDQLDQALLSYSKRFSIYLLVRCRKVSRRNLSHEIFFEDDSELAKHRFRHC